MIIADVQIREHWNFDNDDIVVSVLSEYKCPFCGDRLNLLFADDRIEASCVGCGRMRGYSQEEWQKILSGEAVIDKGETA